jgi:aspartyl-tRNA(Asn)/glutamyl-tRNA(Gln) amidotransferase subunit B
MMLATIGLEVHAQLRTRSKIFCGCPTDFGSPPNAHTCPVCLGLPGALPVLNAEAVQMAVLAGLATQCAIQPRSTFARKNYFYPDLPKGYQISQAAEPLCTGGWLDIATESGTKRCRIQRIHLEEDAGKSSHEASTGVSLIDLNRAGVPLIEIVGQPDLASPDEAVAYLRELRAILVCLGVCDGNMEEGSLRCDANVSVRVQDSDPLGTRCEIKNLNTFRGVRDALHYEIARQSEVVASGGAVAQQTRLWNTQAGRTEPMRSKEEAHDYRYFPDPDLPPLAVAADVVDAARARLPELPSARRARMQRDLGLTPVQAMQLCDEPARADAFERTLGPVPDSHRATGFANFLLGQVAAAVTRSTRTWAEVDAALPVLAELCDRWRAGALSNKMLADVLQSAFSATTPLSATLAAVLSQAGEVQSDATVLAQAIDEVLAANPAQVAKFRSGQGQLIGYFVGQVMRRLGGKANAQMVNELLRDRLS